MPEGDVRHRTGDGQLLAIDPVVEHLSDGMADQAASANEVVTLDHHGTRPRLLDDQQTTAVRSDDIEPDGEGCAGSSERLDVDALLARIGREVVGRDLDVTGTLDLDQVLSAVDRRIACGIRYCGP